MINGVIDISHHNSLTNFPKAKAAGVIGVIHRATQGQGGSDRTYKLRRQRALDAGLLWGAYHFGTGSDGVRQAQHFLEIVGDPTETLLVLDFEDNPTGPSMDLVEARSFVTHVHSQVGRCPGFYSGHTIKQKLGSHDDPVLAKCWFWLAQYGPTPVFTPNWKKWTMWQYTDGSLGPEPHDVAGIGHCDRDKFNGSEAQLRSLWSGR